MDLQEFRLSCLKMAYEHGGKADSLLSAANALMDFVLKDPAPAVVEEPAPATGTSAGAADGAGDRLVAVNNEDLRDLQNAAAADGGAEDTAPAPGAADPGVDVESEQLFADEQTPPEPEQTEAPVATPTPTPAATPVSTEPSLVSRALGWLASPLLWIVSGPAGASKNITLTTRR